MGSQGDEETPANMERYALARDAWRQWFKYHGDAMPESDEVWKEWADYFQGNAQIEKPSQADLASILAEAHGHLDGSSAWSAHSSWQHWGGQGSAAPATQAKQREGRNANDDSMIVDADEAMICHPCEPCGVHGFLNDKAMGIYQDQKLLWRLNHSPESITVGKLVGETAWTSAVASQNDIIQHVLVDDWEQENPKLKPNLFWLLHPVGSIHNSQALVVCKTCAGVLKVRQYKSANAKPIKENADAMRIFFKIPEPQAASLPQQQAGDCYAQKLHGNDADKFKPVKRNDLCALEKGRPCEWRAEMPAYPLSAWTLQQSLDSRCRNDIETNALGPRFEQKKIDDLRFYYNRHSKSKTLSVWILCMKCQALVEIPNIKSANKELEKLAVQQLREYLCLAREEKPEADDVLEPACWFIETKTPPNEEIVQEPKTRPQSWDDDEQWSGDGGAWWDQTDQSGWRGGQWTGWSGGKGGWGGCGEAAWSTAETPGSASGHNEAIHQV